MDALKLKTILEISLGFLIFIGVPGISAGLWLDRYNRRTKVKEANVDKINKPNRGRAKKKS